MRANDNNLVSWRRWLDETSEKSFNWCAAQYFRSPPSENENKTSIYETSDAREEENL
jgi:hypothetical protein